jgi:uncharacterized protein (UPF0332 family)
MLFFHPAIFIDQAGFVKIFQKLNLRCSQVIGAYGLHFAKTKELDPKYHRWLVDAFDIRISGDYGVDTDISASVVAGMINQAREFLEVAQKYLEK